MKSENFPINLTIITNMLAHYRLPLFEEIHECSDIKLSVVVEEVLGKERRAWHLKPINFPFSVMKKKTLCIGSTRIVIPLDLHRLLNTTNPHVIISGGYSLTTIFSLIYSLAFRIPFLILSGETISSAQHAHYSVIRTFLRKCSVKLATGFLAYGPDAKAYLMSLGIDERKISIINNICDVEPFLQFDDKREARTSAIRMLYVGRLTHKKNLSLLLEAFVEIFKIYPELEMTCVGEGPLRNNLEMYCKEHAIVDKVKFLGEIPSKSMPAVMNQADFLVLPSLYDLWPHVVMEAMASGLPVLCSDKAGIPPYIVRGGENGFFFSPQKTESIVEAIDKLIKKRESWPQMGIQSVSIVREFSIQRSAQVFVDSIKKLYSMEHDSHVT